MNKTVEEWFETIEDDEVRAKAFANLHPEFAGILCTCLSEAITEGFYWEGYNEGFDYWDGVYETHFNNN